MHSDRGSGLLKWRNMIHIHIHLLCLLLFCTALCYILWFKLIDIYCACLKLLVLWFIYLSSYLVLFVFVPTLCSLVLIVNVMHFFKYITLVPLLDFISLMQLPCVVVLVEC